MNLVNFHFMDTILFFQPRRYGSWRRLMTGLQRFASEKAWLVHVLSRPQDNASLGAILQQWKPIGCVVDCSAGEKPPPDNIFLTNKTCTVFLNCWLHNNKTIFPVMCHDSAAVGSLAAESLLTLDLPRYAFVPCKPRRDWSEIRGKAFIAAVSKANKCALEFHGSDLKAWLLSLTKPCGIFAANDQMAQNVVATALAAGLRIPEDLSVLGVDNDEIYCEGTIPGISSIATDMDAAGYSLGRLLANTIKKPRPTSSIQLYGPSKIILRGSTRLLSHQVPKVAEAIDFIRRHACSSAIGISDVIKMMGCSRREATQRFKFATGHTILNEIHEVRIGSMREMLETGDMKISAIVGCCGYMSEAFAKKLFRRHTGMTMYAYRKTFSRRDIKKCKANWLLLRQT